MPKLVLFVLDAEIGQPARGMEVSLYRVLDNDELRLIGEATSGRDGCIRMDLTGHAVADSQRYRAIYQSETYFRMRQRKTFYPRIEVEFCVGPDRDLVLPLLISPFAYTIYRGS